ncbi:MAG TPA: multidrug ABC transporter ATP-binding protein [Anaerolineaceae bacterium]|nr:multidrug ABC transporter ATP-binding protein [Anaerolineaceae bacterium]
MDAIEVINLQREFHTTTGVFRRKTKTVNAVNGISFDVLNGELFGLLGPNGAGKTTSVKMLTTLLIPTGGTARILGHDVISEADQLRPRIGFIFGGERGLYWRLSGNDNLRYFASLYYMDPAVAKKRIPYLLEMVGLQDRADEKVEGYSRGMRQRLHIARALLHDPQVLFLDEPTMGLDPVGARELRQTVRNLQSEKKTILLTTHYMFEADALCQRIAVINKGEIVAMDTPANIKDTVNDLSVVELEVFGIPPDMVEKVKSLPVVESASVEDRDQRQLLIVHTSKGAEAIPILVRELQGLKLGKITTREPTLEDAYVRLVGGE